MVELDENLSEFFSYTVNDLSRKYGIPVPRKLGWNRKKNNCGMCSYQNGGEITLNVRFCEENDYCQIYETIVHEMAHYALPGDNHGLKWQELYKKMGGSGERYHNWDYAVSSATAKVMQDRMNK